MESVIWMVPGSAACSIRAATLTSSPRAVYSSRSADPTSADHGEPGVHPDADAEIEPVFRADVVGVVIDRGQDIDRGEHGPLRVVLMRYRCAPESQDGINS